jgi:hypothetical protein
MPLSSDFKTPLKTFAIFYIFKHHGWKAGNVDKSPQFSYIKNTY